MWWAGGGREATPQGLPPAGVAPPIPSSLGRRRQDGEVAAEAACRAEGWQPCRGRQRRGRCVLGRRQGVGCTRWTRCTRARCTPDAPVHGVRARHDTMHTNATTAWRSPPPFKLCSGRTGRAGRAGRGASWAGEPGAVAGVGVTPAACWAWGQWRLGLGAGVVMAVKRRGREATGLASPEAWGCGVAGVRSRTEVQGACARGEVHGGRLGGRHLPLSVCHPVGPTVGAPDRLCTPVGAAGYLAAASERPAGPRRRASTPLCLARPPRPPAASHTSPTPRTRTGSRPAPPPLPELP
jgi:hypothetical protein